MKNNQCYNCLSLEWKDLLYTLHWKYSKKLLLENDMLQHAFIDSEYKKIFYENNYL